MEIYIKLFEVLFPVFSIVGIGYWYGKKDPKFDTKFITTFAGNVGLPCAIFYFLTVSNIEFELFLRFSYYITLYVIIFSIIGILILILGIILFTKTVFLFFKFGNGTIAPWDPPKKFIIRGPYRYVRNPMLIGVNLILISEYLILNSLIIFIWSSIFIVINLIYHKFNEEKKLELRFGNSYTEYKKNVSAWIPRIKPYYKK